MRVLFIVRSSLFKVRGGDTVQIQETARHLESLGVKVDISLTTETIDYSPYDLLHFFNLIRPADILLHIRKSKKPYVVSTIFVEYGEFDKNYRKGLSGAVFKLFSPSFIEYAKTIARIFTTKEKLVSLEYIWLGQKMAVQRVIDEAAGLLPNSENEFKRIQKLYRIDIPYKVIPNGINQQLFKETEVAHEREHDMVLCVARIEGIKNQLNLIKALSGTKFRLYLVGNASPNQLAYYQACQQIAGENVIFVPAVTQDKLIEFYRKAKVHILPSWFETTGLSSLEAAAMGCNIVISNRGDAPEYFGSMARYCEPGIPDSIYSSIEKAANAPLFPGLRKHIFDHYTWEKAAKATLEAYQFFLNRWKGVGSDKLPTENNN
jgi:glycosyltransferase involved in cell wall biosynthesis